MEGDECIRDLSDTLFLRLTRTIGSEEIINNRRFICEVSEKINNILKDCDHEHIRSGSKSEGFRFVDSDDDKMLAYKNIKVIKVTDRFRGSSDDKIVFRMEIDQSRPGFCLLRLITQTNIPGIMDFCVSYQNSLYVSSVLWKNETRHYIPNSNIHGPCENGILGSTDTDLAHCLKCEGWPGLAMPCLKRLIKSKWPSLEVLRRIIHNGYHLVPIGDKTSNNEILEWRISFSVAEKTLIWEMNHCQFLCYGFLKIFFKRFVDESENSTNLICSYFLKTAVFWEISNNSSPWKNQDFLKWFWNCFRRIISWVKTGYCPNFFIPDNNMFLGKVHGTIQKSLLYHLISFYKEGYKCIPTYWCTKCCSLRCATGGMLHPYTFDRDFVKSSIDVNLIYDLLCKVGVHETPHNIPKVISYLKCFRRQISSATKLSPIDYVLGLSNQYFILYNSLLSLSLTMACNKSKYKSVSSSVKNMMRYKFDISSHYIFSAVMLYKFRMYKQVLKIANKALALLKRPIVMDLENLNIHNYKAAGGEYTPIDVMIRSFIISRPMFDKYTCLPELLPEHQSNSLDMLYSPKVLLHFLLCLTYFRLSMHDKADSVLRDLTFIVHYNDSNKTASDIAMSWEMLGICQEFSGYIEEAVLSYLKAFASPKWNYFRNVTKSRIQKLTATYPRRLSSVIELLHRLR